MATLVLSTVGTYFGGPIGSTIGALVGGRIDAAIFGSDTREGPRLADLSVTTSSYGRPIPRHFGTVRTPGTIIWASDLEESSATEGGKGQPKVTSYSYSASFAVALSSRPIDSLGRIWADGNLLRGAAGDLKTGGTLRLYTGHEDQDPDPLLAAVLGAECSAYRGCAYVVFEDLALADFGNRIPTLGFEVRAGSGAEAIAELLDDVDGAATAATFPALRGFSHEGGPLVSMLALMDRLEPLLARSEPGGLAIGNAPTSPPSDIPTLPEAARWDDGDFGREDGVARARHDPARTPSTLRYYDPARDYQPGLQRAEGDPNAAAGGTLEFPGIFAAGDARTLIRRAATRARARQETLSWRCAELDPAIGPGSVVRAPGTVGLWQVAAWEWRESGIEMQLVRWLGLPIPASGSAAGDGWLPPDRLPQPSRLRLFEVPWDGFGSPNDVRAFAAAGAPSGPWSGAALYADRQGALVPLGEAIVRRAVAGVLAQALLSGSPLRYDGNAALVVQLEDDGTSFESAGIDALARGANRLLVGQEIVQFARAEPLGDGAWRLGGLLRGRGGTEHAAMAVHAAGTAVTLLDERLRTIAENTRSQASDDRFAALGLADDEPVFAEVENAGVARMPPFPVHAGAKREDDGSLVLSWTRRARGGWPWLDEVEQPLVEQGEHYEVGLGPADAPLASWVTGTPSLMLDGATLDALAQAHGEQPLWVRQVGSFAKSLPLFLTANAPSQ